MGGRGVWVSPRLGYRCALACLPRDTSPAARSHADAGVDALSGPVNRDGHERWGGVVEGVGGLGCGAESGGAAG